MIHCDEPDVPAGGFFSGVDLSVHSQVTYHCEAGHLLRGDATSTCLNSATWSALAPTCTCKHGKLISLAPHSQSSETLQNPFKVIKTLAKSSETFRNPFKVIENLAKPLQSHRKPCKTLAKSLESIRNLKKNPFKVVRTRQKP